MFREFCFILILMFDFSMVPAIGEWGFLGPEGVTLAGRFTFSPAAPDVVYAVASGPLFKTTDAGEHWQPLPDAPQYIYQALAASPSQPGVLYAASPTDPLAKFLVRSDDGGHTWEKLTQPVQMGAPVSFSELAVHPQNPMIVYGVKGSVYRSADGGRTWQELKNGLENPVRSDEPGFVGLQRIAIDPKLPEILYTAGTMGVFKSVDGGETWRAIDQGIPISPQRGINVQFIAVDPNITGNVYLSVDGDILGSADGGEHWRNLTSGKLAEAPRFLKLAISPVDSDRLYAASQSGIFQSVNGGDRWQRIWKGQQVWDIAVHPTNPNRIYASVNNIGFLRSDDGGKTWQPKSRGMDAIFVDAVAISRRNAQVAYTGGLSFYRSEDGGKTWQLTGEGLAQLWSRFGMVQFSDFSVYPTDERVIYASASSEGGLAKSEDGGESWKILSGVNASITHISIDPRRPTRLYVSTAARGIPGLGRLYRSLNAGETWEEITPPFIPFPKPLETRRIANVVFHPMDSNIIFVGNEAGVGRSIDGGETWEDVSTGLPGNVNFIAIDPKDGDVLFAVDDQRVYRTINGGEQWKAVANIPAQSSLLKRLAISPKGASTAVYVAGDQQVWLSIDRGNSWRPIDDNLPPFHRIRELIVHPTEAGTLWVATSRGLFQDRLSGVVAVFPKSQQLTAWGAIKQTQLLPNYPNPFNPETWIPYQLVHAVEVTFRVYDLSGQITRQFDLGMQPAGRYLSRERAVYWDGKNNAGEAVGSGLYFYEMQAGSDTFVRKAVLLK